MEIDFDKEIDALLRKARNDSPVHVGDVVASGHLDADQISTFAENMVPERSKPLYMAHMADCDRCRKILSNVLTMNSETAQAAAPSPSMVTITEHSIPWYRRLMLFPNLAYVMGGLVLVFTGFLGYTVIRNTGGGESQAVSQITEDGTRSSGPNFQNDAAFPAAPSSNMAANANANIATNVVSNTAVNRSTESAGRGERGPLAESAMRDSQNFALDGVDATSGAGSPLPPATATQPAPKTLAKERDETLAKTEAPQVAGAAVQDPSKNDLNLMRQQSPNVQSQSGPMRNSDNQYNRQLENMERREADRKKVARSIIEENTGPRRIGGRTFERKQGVWYDVAYQGSPTINVRRGSAEFNKLDGGLRSIANSLSGTVVVVWGTRAYRIQ